MFSWNYYCIRFALSAILSHQSQFSAWQNSLNRPIVCCCAVKHQSLSLKNVLSDGTSIKLLELNYPLKALQMFELFAWYIIAMECIFSCIFVFMYFLVMSADLKVFMQMETNLLCWFEEKQSSYVTFVPLNCGLVYAR